MNRSLRNSFLLISFLLALVACAPVTPNLRDDSMMHDREMVAQDPECEAPCWRTITPGYTTWEEAIEYLNTLVWSLEENTSGIIAELEVEELEDTEDIHSIATFRPVRSRQIGALCCQLFTRTGESVDVLIIQVAPSQRLGMTVGAFSEKYGAPDYLVGSVYDRDDEQALINMIYPDIPMVIYAYVDNGAEGELRDRNEVIGFMLTTYDEMQTILTSNNLHRYEGNAPFQVYSSDEDAEFELRIGDEIGWSPPLTTWEILAENDFSHLITALETLGISDALQSIQPYTIFAPSNAAIETAVAEFGLTLEGFLADQELLANVLAYHLVPNNIRYNALVNDTSAKTALGANINYSVIDPNPPLEEGETRDPWAILQPLEIAFNERAQLTADFVASNGWVYAIDQVLLPPENSLKPLEELLTALGAGQ